MGHRFARWRALPGTQRYELLICLLGLGVIHAALATAGYARTRRWVDEWSRHPQSRTATAAELEDAVTLARLAAIAGSKGPVQASCLRQSLLVYGWLRRRALQPSLHFGVKEQAGPFEAHAWVQLEGVRLLPSDGPYREFQRPD